MSDSNHAQLPRNRRDSYAGQKTSNSIRSHQSSTPISGKAPIGPQDPSNRSERPRSSRETRSDCDILKRLEARAKSPRETRSECKTLRRLGACARSSRETRIERPEGPSTFPHITPPPPSTPPHPPPHPPPATPRASDGQAPLTPTAPHPRPPGASGRSVSPRLRVA